MKRRFQKLTALLAAATMLSTALTGCGNETTGNNNVETNTQVSTESSSTVSTETKEKEFSYPMESTTITYSVYLGSEISKHYESMTDSFFSQKMEEATGIHVEFKHNGGLKQSEWMDKMFADGNYCDIIEYGGWATKYPGGFAGACADGVILELNDVIDQYMPNFKAYLEEHPEVDRLIKSDDGKYYHIPAVMSEPTMGATHGYYIRQDWLDELKIEMPTTMDGWHDALVKIKEAKGVAPICTSTAGILRVAGFLNAYCPSALENRYSVDAETGKVVFTAATDEFKEYLKVMAQWYKEGLIDKDVATLDSATIKAKMLTGEAAMTYGYAGSGLQQTMMEGMKENPNYVLTAVPSIAKEEGAEILYNSASPYVGSTYACISAQCENVEAAARYLDYYWSEEGIILTNFGVEGLTYTMENGIPTYTDEIMKNPDGHSVTQALGKYVRAMRGFPGIQDYYYLVGYYELPQVKEAPSAWAKAGVSSYPLTGLSYTTDEAEALASINSEVNTYTDEMTVKFLLGTEDIEAKWDEYVANLNKFGLDEAIEINQAAYERFVAR